MNKLYDFFIDEDEVLKIDIPEGQILEIMNSNRDTMWNCTSHRCVVLGDSIAAGHGIDNSWYDDYNIESQYGRNGNQETAIVPNSFADLLCKKNREKYDTSYEKAYTASFAQSGLTPAALINMLNERPVQHAVSKADEVVICVIANDVLQPALHGLAKYITYGNISEIEAEVNKQLNLLKDDNNSPLLLLLQKLYTINPTAKYIFTTIYNPMKYLYFEPSTPENNYSDGFFGPVLSAIPDSWEIYVPILELTVTGQQLKENLYTASFFQAMLARINGISEYAEKWVCNMNSILTNKIKQFNEKYETTIKTIDTKSLFDIYPNRNVGDSSTLRHYNDLVNVEITKYFNVAQVNWGDFWDYLYENTSKIVDCLVDWDFTSLFNDVLQEAFVTTVEKDLDVHPELYGHYLLYAGYATELGIEKNIIKYRTVTFHANDGMTTRSTSIQIPYIDQNPCFTVPGGKFTHPNSYSMFKSWSASPDGSSGNYEEGDIIFLNSDLDLYTQWNDTIYLHIDGRIHDKSTHLYGQSGVTGIKQDYCICKYNSNSGQWERIPNDYDSGQYYLHNLFSLESGLNADTNPITGHYGDRFRVYICPWNDATAEWPYLDPRTDNWLDYYLISQGRETGNIWYIYNMHWKENFKLSFQDWDYSHYLPESFSDITLDMANELGLDGFLGDLAANTVDSTTKENLCQSIITVSQNNGATIVRKGSGTEKDNYNNWIYVEFRVVGRDTTINFIYYEPNPSERKVSLNGEKDLNLSDLSVTVKDPVFGITILTANAELGSAKFSADARFRMWDCEITSNNIDSVTFGTEGPP